MVDVTPKPGVHVYAPGATALTPVTMVMTPFSGLRFSRAKYPAPEAATALTAPDPAPAYYAPFRIEQRMSVARGEMVTCASLELDLGSDDGVGDPDARMAA